MARYGPQKCSGNVGNVGNVGNFGNVAIFLRKKFWIGGNFGNVVMLL